MNSAGTAFISIEPELKGFGKRLTSGIDPHVDKVAKNAQAKFSGAFGNIAKVAGGMFAAKLGVDAFKGLIGGASDLNETISKSRSIFGDQGAAIEAWAGTAAKSFGQSKQGALDAAATFGNLFVQLGTGSGEAAKMSKEMVGLASDFASFHNADPTDVIDSMTAAFRGEYDAVQRYVPTINAAAVEQEALKMGLAKTTKELTAQDKALATQALLMKGAGAAVGDFAKTSDGLANRQRILSAQFQDMKDKIGTALLPVVLRIMDAFMGLGKVFQDNMPVFAAIGAIVAAVIVPAFISWAAAAAAAAAAQFAVIAPVAAVVVGLAALAAAAVWAYQNFEGFRSVVDAVAGFLVDTVWPKIQQFAGLIAEQFGSLVGFVQGHWRAIQEAIGHVVAVVSGIIGGFISAVQAAWSIFGDEIVNIARIVWDQVRNIVETVVGIVSGVITAGLAIINGEWGAAWDAIKGTVSTAGGFIVESIRNAIRTLREAVEGGISAVVAVVAAVPGRIIGALGSVGSLLYNAGRSIMEGLGRGIRDAVQGVYNFVSGIAGKIASLKGPLEYDRKLLFPAGEAIMGGLMRGLRAEEGRLAAQLRGYSALFEGWAGGTVGATVTHSLTTGALEHGRADVAPRITVPVPTAPALEGRDAGLEGMGGIDYAKLAAFLDSRPVVLNINGREFARATAGDISREQFQQGRARR